MMSRHDTREMLHPIDSKKGLECLGQYCRIRNVSECRFERVNESEYHSTSLSHGLSQHSLKVVDLVILQTFQYPSRSGRNNVLKSFYDFFVSLPFAVQSHTLAIKRQKYPKMAPSPKIQSLAVQTVAGLSVRGYRCTAPYHPRVTKRHHQ
jgi:hypothetical protein